MEIAFSKYQGLGNDFVIVRETANRFAVTEAMVARVCDRHFGVGADGFIMLSAARADKPDPSAPDHFRMIFYNPDGSPSQMCGNGLRCVARYLADELLANGDAVNIMTEDGVREARFGTGPDREITVDMGRPKMLPKDIPADFEGDHVIGQVLEVGGERLSVTCLSMGNPHCVVFVDEIEDDAVRTLGPAIENHPRFPEKTNVEFVVAEDRRSLRVVVWERGAGLTLACGSGACAAAVAAHLNGLTEKGETSVVLPGGRLKVDWGPEEGLYLTGPAERVFSGIIEVESPA